MHRRTLSLIAALMLMALPMSASQFIELPFDEVARGAQYVVRGTILETWSAWDDAHEVIYTYANVRVTRYLGESTGPDVLLIREVGGTVDGYTQEAIGFPIIRSGENVVLFLAPWEDGTALRIHAFNQGKFLVRERGAVAMVIPDPERQGDARLGHPDHRLPGIHSDAAGDLSGALTLDELARMVDDARAGHSVTLPTRERR